MTEEDSSYFERREREERDAAKRAADERARHSHESLADQFAEAAKTGLHPVELGDEPTGLTPEFKIIPPQRG